VILILCTAGEDRFGLSFAPISVNSRINFGVPEAWVAAMAQSFGLEDYKVWMGSLRPRGREGLGLVTVLRVLGSGSWRLGILALKGSLLTQRRRAAKPQPDLQPGLTIEPRQKQSRQRLIPWGISLKMRDSHLLHRRRASTPATVGSSSTGTDQERYSEPTAAFPGWVSQTAMAALMAG
jgi:hypothetical protein